jgi:hypothetical protein
MAMNMPTHMMAKPGHAEADRLSAFDAAVSMPPLHLHISPVTERAGSRAVQWRSIPPVDPPRTSE